MLILKASALQMRIDRDWVKRYLVMPPFTQHSDASQHDTDNHGQHSKPTNDEATGFEPSVEMEDKTKEQNE